MRIFCISKFAHKFYNSFFAQFLVFLKNTRNSAQKNRYDIRTQKKMKEKYTLKGFVDIILKDKHELTA